MNAEVFTEWRNNNQNVNYPFSDIASLRNTDNVVVDRDLFDDARLYPIGGTADLYLRSIEVTDTQLVFHIGIPSGELCSGRFLLNGPAPAEVALADQYGRPAGILISSEDRLIALANFYGKGTFEFTQTQTPFAPTVIVPLPQPGLRGVLLDDGGLVTGDLYLLGTEGVVLRYDLDAIQIDVIGDPYARIKECRDEGFPVELFCGVRTINEIPPDPLTGDFRLTPGGNVAADNVLRIESDGEVLKISVVGAIGTRNARP